jgi:hypothetical protein
MQRTILIFLSIALTLTSSCSLFLNKSVTHDFPHGVSAYGYQLSTASYSGLWFTHIRFGDLYSTYPIQPVRGITISVDGNDFDLEKLDKTKLVDIFLESGSCKRDLTITDSVWESCMSSFAWGRVINHKVDFLEIHYRSTEHEQPTITNRTNNLSYKLPLSEHELFALFGTPIKTKKYIMY